MEFGHAMENEFQKESVWVPATPAKPVPARPGLDSITTEWKTHLGPSSLARDLQESMNFNAMISIDKNRGLYNGDAAFASKKGTGNGFDSTGTIDSNKSVYNLEFRDSSRGGHLGGVFAGKQRIENHNEACTSIDSGFSEDLEGTKGDGVAKSFGFTNSSSAGLKDCGAISGGLDNNSFTELIKLPDATPRASELSASAISECVVGVLSTDTLLPASHYQIDDMNTQGILASASATSQATFNGHGMTGISSSLSDSQIGCCVNTESLLFASHDYTLVTIPKNNNNSRATPQYDRLYQEKEKDEVPCEGNEDSELQNDENSQCGVGLAASAVSTPSEKQNVRKRRNNGIDLNKKPRQTPKLTKHRPKVIVEGKPRKTPKPRTPKLSTPKPRTPKPSTPKRATLKKKKSPHEKRKNSLNAFLHYSEDGQAIDTNREHATKSCRQALNFDLENQVRDEKDIREIVTSKESPDLKRKYVRKNHLKALTNCSEGVDGQAVGPNPEHALKSCSRTLSFNLENQARDEKDVRKIVRQYQRRSKNLDKSSWKWDFNLNLEPQESNFCTEMNGKAVTNTTAWSNKGKEPMVENLASMACGFTHSTNYIQTEYMSLAEGETASYQKNPCATNQTGCHHNSLLVHQRIFHVCECLKNSRKLGPNFPRLYKKKRMRRRRAAMYSTLWSVIAAEDGQRQVKACSRRKVTVSLCISRTTKKRLARQVIPKKMRKGIRNSKELDNSATTSCTSLMQNRIVGMISPTDKQTRAAINNPEYFKCMLTLSPMVNSKRKRSKGFTRRRNLASSTANANCNQLPLTPLLQALDGGRQGIENHEPKAYMEARLADNENMVTRRQNKMKFSLHNGVSYHNETEGSPPQCKDIWLEIEMCPRQDTGHCPRQQENVTLEIEGSSPKCENVLLPPERNLQIPSSESSQDALLGALIDSVIHRSECLHISDECGQLAVRDQNVHGAHSGNGTINPYEGQFDPSKKCKAAPKVDLDPEIMRVWKLVMENNASEGVEEADKNKEKWWEGQREVFRGRVDSFIARMHLIQGNRRFSPWKGSVVDSVVGVYLTQNVSDHLSSSAFMSLAARFPLQSTSIHREYDDDWEIKCIQKSVGSNIEADRQAYDANAKQSVVCETEKDVRYQFAENREESLGTRIGPAISDAAEDSMLVKDAFLFQNFVGSSPDGNPTTTRKPCTMENCTSFTELLISEETGFLQEIYSQDNEKLSCDESLVDGNIESRGTENRKERSSSDRLFYLKGAHASVCSLSSPNTCSAIPLAPSDLDLDSLGHLGDCRNSKKKDVRDIRKNLGSGEFSSNDTVIQKKARPRAQGAKTVGPSASIGMCQVSPDGSLQAEVMTEKNLHSSNNHQGGNKMVLQYETTTRRKKTKVEEKLENATDWDDLRKTYSNGRARETTGNTMDSVDWEGVRCATVKEVSDTIMERGMNNVLAARIKEFLDRMVKDHGSIDLEWLRDVPPDKVKEYLLSIRGLGLKSVECVRLLTLRHLAFPVDTNVGRVAVRLGWVPLQPLPEAVQIHLLNQYPMLNTIQKYLWPRLCTLDQPTLYELHYQMITFGKVFCTKKQPNCHACPMRGECRHFASAVASAKLALPRPREKSVVTSKARGAAVEKPTVHITPTPLSLLEFNFSESRYQTQNCYPIIEVPASPESEHTETLERDIENFYSEPEDEMPTIRLNMEEFKENLPDYVDKKNTLLQEGDMSKALVALTSEAASIPVPKLKYASRLRTVHHVYELPDSHPLLVGLDKREPDDPCPYLLAIWAPGKNANSSKPPQKRCDSQESELCNDDTCFSFSHNHEQNIQTICGTILIPCRTAMRGSFPLNGTYFQVNEVFADDESSQHPINVPRAWIWNLARRTLYCGTLNNINL